MQKSVQHIEHQQNKVVRGRIPSRLVWRGMLLLFTTILFTGLVSAQTVSAGTLTINGSFINAGTITVNNNILNNTTGAVTVLPGAVGSTVRLTGAANANGHTIYGGGPINFYRLDLRGGRETRLKVNVEVTNRLQVGYTANTFTAADSGFTIENNTLTIDSLATYLGTANLTFAGGTVAYTCSNSLTPPVPTINKTSGVRYGSLNFSGAAAKSLSAATSGPDTAATLTQTGGQLSILGNFDVTATASFADLGAISATKTMRLTGTATSGTVSTMNNSSTGIFENASTAGTLTFTGVATNNSGTIANTSTGTITFVNNLTGTGTVSQTAGGTMNVNGSFTQNTYTLTGGTVIYNGTAAQNIIGTTYNNLTISTTGGNASALAAITLTGNLIISSGSTLDMGTYSTSTFPGTNDNAGTIRWSGDNVYVRSAGTTGTTEFYSATAGSVAAGISYRDLLFTGTNKTIGNAITATGNMTVNSGASVTVSGVTIQINGYVFNSAILTNNGTINIGN